MTLPRTILQSFSIHWVSFSILTCIRYHSVFQWPFWHWDPSSWWRLSNALCISHASWIESDFRWLWNCSLTLYNICKALLRPWLSLSPIYKAKNTDSYTQIKVIVQLTLVIIKVTLFLTPMWFLSVLPLCLCHKFKEYYAINLKCYICDTLG